MTTLSDQTEQVSINHLIIRKKIFSFKKNNNNWQLQKRAFLCAASRGQQKKNGVGVKEVLLVSNNVHEMIGGVVIVWLTLKATTELHYVAKQQPADNSTGSHRPKQTKVPSFRFQ